MFTYKLLYYKSVLQVKNQNAEQSFDSSISHRNTEYDLNKSVKGIEQKELHKERIQALRKELDYLKSTDWEFESDKGFAH